jgi:hypothetical protein
MRTSNSTFSLVCLVLFLGAVTMDALRAEDKAAIASTAQTETDISYLMLQDGGLVEGKITPAADWYIVSRSGGQMQVAKSRVILACRTLEEAYAYRRAQIIESKPGPHLALADWCLRYGLLKDCEQELEAVRRLDSDQPRLALLERRLEKMRSQPTTKPIPATLPKMPTKTTSESATKSSATIDLPNGVVERFTRKVQPILVNNCTTSACHQPGGRQSFQLDRAILRGEANRRSTMHNLEATLALVDRDNPEQSPLLVIGRKKHGGMAGPIFGTRQEQAFKHVTEWVSLVAPPTKSEEAEEIGEGSTVAPLPAEQVKERPHVSSSNAKTDKRELTLSDKRTSRTPPTRTATESSVIEATAIDDDALRTLRQPHHLLYGGRLEPWRPRDPFDPEIFNRLQRSNPAAVQDAGQTRTTPPTHEVQSTADQPH